MTWAEGYNALVVIVGTIIVVFFIDAVVRHRRENAWRRHRPDRDDDDLPVV